MENSPRACKGVARGPSGLGEWTRARISESDDIEDLDRIGEANL
jgi:hypothetical protein